ncbi:hypothetical protein Tco_0690139 [Tanacetum coccineum]
MEAKEKGAVLDAEAEAFLTDVECTSPYDEQLAITTTNVFEVSHKDAYDSDVDEGPNTVAAFMANLSSINGATTSNVNEVRTSDNHLFDNVNHLLTHELHQEEHLDSNVESDIDDNTIPYHQYQLDSEVKSVPIEVSSVSPGEISMITILDDLRTQLDGHLKVNQEQSLVNDSLRAELEKCKARDEIFERNKSNLSKKDESINFLKTESKKVLFEKKDLEERYLEEIVCLKNANKVATKILQKFQQPTQTIPMLTKRPKLATHDLHKTALGSSNPWFAKKAKLAQPTLYNGHALLKPTHTPVRVHDSEDSLVQAEISRTKMSERPGTIQPINYAELNALYSHFVPQKELSREQVYWLPADERTTQISDPPKLVTPFVYTRPTLSKVRTQLLKLKDSFPTFEEIIKRRTTPTFHEQGEWRFVPTKKAFTEQVIPFYEHVKELVQSLEENLVKEVTKFMQNFDELDAEYEQCIHEKKKLQIEKKNLLIKNECLITDSIAKDICSIGLASDRDRPPSRTIPNMLWEHSKVVELEAEILKQQQMLAESDKRCAFIEKNHIDLQLKEQLQGNDDTIRNLQTQINITKMLKVGPTVGSFDKQALKTELTQLKDAITSLRIQNDGFRVENVNLKRLYQELSTSNSHSRDVLTGKVTALTAENAKLKSELLSKIHSEPTVPEKPKVLASGMYTNSSKPQWKPTGRHFALYDNCPLTRIMEPIVEPLELTPSVSSSSKVTMISRFTDCKLSDRKAGSKGISGIFEC